MKKYRWHYVCSLVAFVCVLLTTSCSESDGYSAGSETGQGGSMARFTVQGDNLYTVDNHSLKTFDISDAKKPTYLKGKDQPLQSDAETLFAMDTLLFIGSRSGMSIYNITRPEFPSLMSHVSHITSCDPVVAAGHYAYVTLSSDNMQCFRGANEMHIYNISDPTNPDLVNVNTSLTRPRGLGIDGKKLFVCDNGLKVFDISDPENPVWVDDLTKIPEANGIDAYDVIPMNGLLFLIGADGFYQFDYTTEKLAFVSKIAVTPQDN